MVRKFRKRSSLVALKRFVYLISPSKINHSFYENLDKVLSSNNIKFFQLRLKKTSKKKIILISKKIKKITKKYRVNFIINDDPIIAKIVNADGCHLGQADMDLTLARKYMGKKILGITCHGSKRLILKAIKKKPNYLALGSFFKSRLKPKAKKSKKELLKWTKNKTRIPIVAIGGIDSKNYKKILKTGANYIAISSFIWNNPSLTPELAIQKFKK
tara:strand:- start:140 stop:784 length:645 start_codon:yes stop_codon:yes gene_type:complete